MHFKGLDLNLLVILDALLDERNVTKAAERVHVSQPAVSAALAKLRAHLGDELLQKVGRDYRLTPRAEAMARPVKEILLQIEATIYSGPEFDPSATERTFAIAMTSYVGEVLTPILLKELATSFPAISCVVTELEADSLAKLNRGGLDCCITFQQTNLLNPREPTDELSFAHLFSDEWVLIAAAHNDRVEANMAYEDFCAMPYVMAGAGAKLRSLADQLLDHKSNRPHASISVPSFEMAITNVRNSDCVTVVPSLLVDETLRPYLKLSRPPFDMPAIEEFLVWHQRNDIDPGHTWFRQLIMQVAAGLRAPSPGQGVS